MENEEIIMGIIINGGNARSNSICSIKEAKDGNFEEAMKLLEKANEDLRMAHRVQTDLIQKEARGEKTEITLLIIHAQDHLMNAMTVRDLAEEMIDLYKKINKIG